MFVHLGRGIVVDDKDILAIVDFEKLTSFKRGQDFLEEFIKREDIDNPEGQFFPQSCVFVLKENEIDEEFLDKQEAIQDNIEYYKEKSGTRGYVFEEDERFLPGGEFYLDEDVVYTKVKGKVPGIQEKIKRLAKFKFPGFYFEFFSTMEYEDGDIIKHRFHPGEDERLFTDDKNLFFGFPIEKVNSILPEYNIFEKWKFALAYFIVNAEEYGDKEAIKIIRTEGIEHAIGFGRIYTYGEKIYYKEKDRLYIYVSEFTPQTLLKRIKEAQGMIFNEDK